MMFVFVFLIGLAVGSFLNVLIDRLPKGENVFMGRSHCDFCKKTLRWYELVPLFSFLLQGGRCRRCHKQLSIQYPVVELITGLGFVFFYQVLDYPFLTLIAYLIIFSSLLVIFVADLKYQIIPDSMIVTGSIGALLRLSSVNRLIPPSGWQPYILSALGASAFFFILWLVTRGRGMGFGDVKLAFLLGLLLGFPGIIIALYVAFLTGAVVGVILIIGGKKTLKTKVPFGPFLIFGFIIAWKWTLPILHIWRNFF